LKKKISIKKLLNLCSSENDKKKIIEIFNYRKKVFKENKFCNNDYIFKLNFKKFKIFLNYKSSFSALEVLYEIFVENDHMNCAGFNGYNKKIILDLGSHNGFYAMKLKLQNPNLKILCYEANIREIKLAKMNFKANSINKNIILKHSFVSGSNKKEIDFNYVEELPAISGLNLKNRNRKWLKNNFIKKIKINNINLNSIIKNNKLKKIDILKIDVEGAEFEILKKFKYFELVSRITVEFHNGKIKSALKNFLKTKNFTLVKEDQNNNFIYGNLYFENIGYKND
jgi:FkbM family methyltransferase